MNDLEGDRDHYLDPEVFITPLISSTGALVKICTV